MGRLIDLITTFAGSGTRLGAGMFAEGHREAPLAPIELYDMEGCPYCRKVRDALTTLDIDALIFPCPKNGQVHRPRARALAGKEQFPFLVDPNQSVSMLESNDIIRYLFATYGQGGPSLRTTFTASSMISSLVRPLRGTRARPSRQPERPLELWAFEASPYCRLARETLCELELPYVLHSVGKGKVGDFMLPGMRDHAPEKQTTARRRAFVERTGRMMVPFLADPNTGTEMFESAAIQAYLERTYAA